MDVRVGPKESWVPKNWCKEIETVNSKGNQCWMFIGRTDAEAPILWPPDAKSWLTEKDLNVGKDWRQVEKGMTEDEMVGWHHRLDGHEFEQAPGDGEGQGSLVCCSPWGRKDWTQLIDWTELNWNINIWTQCTIGKWKSPSLLWCRKWGRDKFPGGRIHSRILAPYRLNLN